MFPKTKYSTNSRAIWFFFLIQSEQAISVRLNHVNAAWVKDMTWRHPEKKEEEEEKKRGYVMAYYRELGNCRELQQSVNIDSSQLLYAYWKIKNLKCLNRTIIN